MDDGLERELGELLAALAAQPSVSFHEAGVARVARVWLGARGVAVEADEYGNLLARAGGRARRRGGVPPLVLVAHLDHPGVHLMGGGRARLAGGVAPSALAGRVPVRVLGRRGECRGHLLEFDAASRAFRYEGPMPGRGPAFAVWDFPDFVDTPDRWTMRAADDLVGVAAILSLVGYVAAEGSDRQVIGALTRAEEVGLIGATLLAQSRRLPSDALVLSVEASRELPGAVVGAGPIVRVGDRTSTFSPTVEALLYAAATDLAGREPAFRFQRQLMSGGTCEATVFTLFGYQTGALAVPLGNYHNVDPEGRLAAEYVSPQDVANLARLLRAVLGPVRDSQRPLRGRFSRAARGAAARLRATAASMSDAAVPGGRGRGSIL
jgi:endoglucanase